MKYTIIILWLLIGASIPLAAQVDVANSEITFTIPEITQLDIEPDNAPVIIRLQPSNNNPNSLQNLSASDNSKWINYTCALAPQSANRSVYIQINQGSIPIGMSVTAEASNPVGGAGQLGIAIGSVPLTMSPRRLITDIGGCYTGDGENFGHNILYTVRLDDVERLGTSSEIMLNVVYTITE
ncbi:MAG: hypothetical protein AB8G22_07650 [Saprospiraceae bacterium]